MSTSSPAFGGPGFATVMLDIPFSLGLPNGGYRVFDPVKGIAIVQPTMREGSRSFFRNAPIIGPTSFHDLKEKAREYERPRQEYSYVATSVLSDGTQKATLNVHCGNDGGFAETKYFSEVQITFLEDDLGVVGRKDNYILQRATDILNPFLDKYRLFAEDYRVSRVSADRNYYLAVCHTSPLTKGELGLTPGELFEKLSKGRTFLQKLGHGASNILRTNSLDHLAPRSRLAGAPLATFESFVLWNYEVPLSYDLIMQAERSLQIDRDIKLSIVHAATAVEVHTLHLLHNLLIQLGATAPDAWDVLENDDRYIGAKNRIKRLEQHVHEHCEKHGMAFRPFLGNALYNRWDTILARKRNRGVHAGVTAFKWAEGVEAIGIAKECIIFLEQRVPDLANPVQMSSSVAGLRESAGGILF